MALRAPLRNLFVSLLLAFTLAPNLRAEDPPYNELVDGQGNPRAHYSEVLKTYSEMSAIEKEQFLEKSKAAFKGDNALDPLPRLLTSDEFNELKKGVTQRGTALRMFLQDYYAGKHSYTSVVPAEVVKRIIERSGESGYEKLLPPNQVAFPYGPDIIRTTNGKWAVIEDNPGFIGGIGDLNIATETLIKLKPEYANQIAAKYDPMDYYRSVISRAQARANPKGGKVVIYMVPPYPDNEDMRIQQLFKSFGVETVTPHTKNRLIVRKDGVYLRSKDPLARTPEQKVGYLFLNGEHKWIDATHPVTREALVLWEAHSHLEEPDLSPRARKAIEAAIRPNPATRKVSVAAIEAALEKSNFDNELAKVVHESVPGLMTAIFENKVATNYTPGVDFIGDKEFYTYVDDLIRFYLHEEPIVRNIPTRRFGDYAKPGEVQLNRKLFDEVFSPEQLPKLVIKKVDGRGGDGVWIGNKLQPADLPALMERIKKDPGAYIVQDFTPLSEVEDRIVDLRMISDVSSRDVFVSKTPWGRGLPRSGDGKVNLSQNGREFAVIVVDPNGQAPGCLKAVLRRIYEQGTGAK